MLIADTIHNILSNLFVAFFVIAIVTTLVKTRRLRLERRPYNGAYIFWGELLFYSVGIGFLWSGIFHAYFQSIAAPSIGWSPSPFEFELGWAEIGVAIVALMALWRGFEFRLATTIIAAIFGLAAAAQHLQQIACCQNYAPGNAGLILWFGDLFLPLLFVLLAVLSRDEAGSNSRL